MREPISLKEILAVVIKRGGAILLTALVLAAALGAYQLKNQLDLSKLPENSAQYIEEEYQSALTEFAKQKHSLEEEMKRTEQPLEKQKKYVDNSLLMKLDPYHLIKNTNVLSIEIPEYAAQGDLSDQSEDRYVRVLNQIQNYYRTYWNAVDLSQELKSYGISDIEEQYLRELINVQISDSMITITVSGENVKDVQSIADAVSQWFVQLSVSKIADVHPHEIFKLTNVTKTEISNDLLNHQQYHLQFQKELEAKAKEMENQLKNLNAPQKRAGYGKQEMLKNIMKWMIIGAIAGGVLSCGWILVLFMFRSRIESSRQMEQVLGVPFLGSAAKGGSIWKRLSDRILAERTWRDDIQAESYMAEAFRSATDAPEQAVILTTLAAKNLDLSVVEKAVGKVAGKVICVADAERNAETIKALQECKCVMLAERVGVSEIPKMQSLLEQAKRMEATVVGFVTI